jgi:mitochondrial ornithine carrier protein
MVGKVFEYPFDTVKVRLQSQPETRPLRYKGPLDCFKQSLQQAGVRGLYRGISPPLFGAAAENAALFFGYNLCQEAIRNITGQRDGELSIQQKLFCGAASGAFASFILTPIELVKCQMQVQMIGKATVSANVVPKAVGGIQPVAAIHTASIRPPGPFALVGQIYRAYGLPGLWRGQMGTLLRETGGSAAWFGSYEFVSMKFKEIGKKDSTSIGESMMAGATGESHN